MDLASLLAAAENSLANACRALSNGDVFAAGAHYRAASDNLVAVSKLDTRNPWAIPSQENTEDTPGLGF